MIERTTSPGPDAARSPHPHLRLAALAAGALLASTIALAPTVAHAAVTLVDDAYDVPANALFTTTAARGVLANDLEVPTGADPAIFDMVVHGQLTLERDGGFSYIPATGFVGEDSFTYCFRSIPLGPCLGDTATVTLSVHSVVERVSGADRFAVSANISAAKFDPQVATAFVASGAVFPDALSASAAAGAEGGPVLLVTRDSVPAVIAAELTRLRPQRIVVLGGTNTIGAGVETALHDFSMNVSRIGGADRYAVSAGVSAATFGAMRPTVYVASGEVFPDALSGSAAAGAASGPVLLVQKNAVPAVVATELARLRPASIVVLGGPNTVSAAVLTTLGATAPTTRISGADRYEVSANAALNFSVENTHTIYVASGEVFPDALSGSAAAIGDEAPVLLVTKGGIPATVAAQLTRFDPVRIVVLGGTNTISDAVATQLEAYLA
jgi:putative cell wall-binding protein